jgi:hypothetical protein
MSENKKNLYYLDDLSGYKVASDDSDVRGWDVVDNENRRVGKVDGLLANKETERVIYLDVEVDQSLIEDDHEAYNKAASEGAHEFVNREGENHLIIPIGLVKVDETEKKVISHEINSNTFAKTKRRKKSDSVDRNYEVTVLRQYFPEESTDEAHMDDEGFYSRREFKRREDNE